MSWFDDLCVFAMHSQTGHRHKVFAVEKQTGKIAWEAWACGGGRGGCTSGFHYAWFSLETTPNNRLFVFGNSSSGFYVHAFDVKNGRTLLSFASNH